MLEETDTFNPGTWIDEQTVMKSMKEQEKQALPLKGNLSWLISRTSVMNEQGPKFSLWHSLLKNHKKLLWGKTFLWNPGGPLPVKVRSMEKDGPYTDFIYSNFTWASVFLN